MEQEEPRLYKLWKQTRSQWKTIKILMICGAAAVAAVAIYEVWELLGSYIKPETPTDRKDHVQVMAVALGAVGAIITAIIGWRNLKQSQRGTERTLENTRLLEEQRAQNDALQKYLELMGNLLTKEELRSSGEDADVRILARSHTLAVLQGLDPDRKRILLDFLHDSGLISKDKPVISLVGAHLGGANLSGANLKETNLNGANLSGANLHNAYLKGTSLIRAALFGANLDIANLEKADLRESSLSGASLNQTFLGGANLSGAYFLGGVYVKESYLGGAKPAVDLPLPLLGPQRGEIKLSEADLSGPNLRGTNLKGAKVTEQQLAYCRLEGAIMPDGSTHD